MRLLSSLSFGILLSKGKCGVHIDALCALTFSRFVLQLISLAGLHTNATITTELSRAFKDEGMLAYVRLVQSREKDLGVDVLTHQKWSGAPYMDGIMGAIQSGSSSSKSMGEGNTEKGEFGITFTFENQLTSSNRFLIFKLRVCNTASFEARLAFCYTRVFVLQCCVTKYVAFRSRNPRMMKCLLPLESPSNPQDMAWPTLEGYAVKYKLEHGNLIHMNVK